MIVEAGRCRRRRDHAARRPFRALEPLGADHAAALHAANRADAAIWDYLPYGPFDSEADYAARLARMAARRDPLFFAPVDPGDQPARWRGQLSADHAGIRIDRGRAYLLAPVLQRTAAASEAIFLMADWAFANGYRRFNGNATRSTAEPARGWSVFGFSYEGIFRQATVVRGRNRDTARFAMVDRDWPCLRAARRTWLDPANFDAAGQQREALGALTGPCRAASDPAL